MFGASSKEIISCIVVENIFNKSEESLKSFKEIFKIITSEGFISNKDYLERCPRNSLIVRIPNSSEYMIVYPFFSSHFCLPVKPGEHVWCFFPGGFGKNRLGYWMTRKATDEQIEDVNFTHNIRSSHKTYFQKIIAKTNENITDKYYGTKGRDFGNYDRVIKGAKANNIHNFENIPRVPKNPSDLLMQGSNNAQILLTSGDEDKTGTIVLTAGRGSTDLTASEEILNTADKKENNKASILSKEGTENLNEGKLDTANDKSILILSENPAYLAETSNSSYEFTDLAHFFARSDIVRMEARNQIYLGAESDISIQSPSIVLGDGSQAYIRYDEFKTLIDAVIDELDGLRQQVNTFCITQTAAISAAGGAPGGYAGLAAGFSTLTSQTSAPYSPGLKSKVSPVQSQKIFGE